MVQCGRKTNTALFSSSTTAPGGQLASSLLSFSLGNNPSEHFNIALSVSFVCTRSAFSLLHLNVFLFILSSQNKYLPTTSEHY